MASSNPTGEILQHIVSDNAAESRFLSGAWNDELIGLPLVLMADNGCLVKAMSYVCR
jgi:hypothetical protein